jgi:hypothetical protein
MQALIYQFYNKLYPKFSAVGVSVDSDRSVDEKEQTVDTESDGALDESRIDTAAAAAPASGEMNPSSGAAFKAYAGAAIPNSDGCPGGANTAGGSSSVLDIVLALLHGMRIQQQELRREKCAKSRDVSS